MGFPDGSAGKESACSAGDLGSIPGLGRSSGEGNGCPLQYSGLENSVDCTVHGVANSWTRLSQLDTTEPLSLSLLVLWAPFQCVCDKFSHPSRQTSRVWEFFQPQNTGVCPLFPHLYQFSSVAQLCLTLFDPMTAAHQASLSLIYIVN